jgi:hypothetical protein
MHACIHPCAQAGETKPNKPASQPKPNPRAGLPHPVRDDAGEGDALLVAAQQGLGVVPAQHALEELGRHADGRVALDALGQSRVPRQAHQVGRLVACVRDAQVGEDLVHDGERAAQGLVGVHGAALVQEGQLRLPQARPGDEGDDEAEERAGELEGFREGQLPLLQGRQGRGLRLRRGLVRGRGRGERTEVEGVGAVYLVCGSVCI